VTRHVVLFFFASLMASGASAFVKTQSVELEELPLTDRWAAKSVVEKQKRIKTAKDPVMKTAIAESLGDWQGCVLAARNVPKKSVVRDWLWLIELNCGRKLTESETKTKDNGYAVGALLASSIASVEANQLAWHNKPLGSKIQQALVSAKFALTRWHNKNSHWKELRVELQKLFKIEFLLNKAERAQLYFFAGELLVAERQWVEAHRQFERSKDLNSDNIIDGKIKSILPMLPPSFRAQLEEKAKALATTEAANLAQAVQPSGEEFEFFNQAQSNLARNDVVGAVEAMANLIRKFPLGIKSKWAQDKIFELLIAETEKSRGPQGTSVLKKKIHSEMLNFDSDRQADWGKTLFDMQAYADAAPLLKKSADQISSSVRASRIYYLAARSYQLSGAYGDAKKIYQLLIRNYPTATEIPDAAIQWGLINYNENDPSEAITHLEIARSRKLTSQQDLVSLFWLYQSYKAKNAEQEMIKAAKELVARFHLTYYGLIAHNELQKKFPEYEVTKPKSAKVNFSSSENFALERARALLSAGMLDAASEELSVFSTRVLSNDEGQYLANYYAQALNYPKSFGMLTGILDVDPIRRTQYVVHQIFPKEFWDLVSDDKKRSGVDPFLLLSIMKQESAFNFNAVSRSGAMGLLQMIPPTAEEVKKELGLKVDISKELFDPATNVRFCAHYYAMLLKRYGGSIPLALAAYNAGPTRISLFVTSQGQIKDTWVDEMPWAETSFYVKSILKNYLMYRMLYGGLTQMPTPPWASGPTSSAK